MDHSSAYFHQQDPDEQFLEKPKNVAEAIDKTLRYLEVHSDTCILTIEDIDEMIRASDLGATQRERLLKLRMQFVLLKDQVDKERDNLLVKIVNPHTRDQLFADLLQWDFS